MGRGVSLISIGIASGNYHSDSRFATAFYFGRDSIQDTGMHRPCSWHSVEALQAEVFSAWHIHGRFEAHEAHHETLQASCCETSTSLDSDAVRCCLSLSVPPGRC